MFSNSHYLCPICKNNIDSLVTWDNLINQYQDSSTIPFCPHCNVGLQLNYDEEYNEDTGEVFEYWSFDIAKRGD